MIQTTVTSGIEAARSVPAKPKRSANSATDAAASWFAFELVDQDDRVVGGGRIIAPGPASAEHSASLLLAGSSRVRVLGVVA
jgi:hypothetical protein